MLRSKGVDTGFQLNIIKQTSDTLVSTLPILAVGFFHKKNSESDSKITIMLNGMSQKAMNFLMMNPSSNIVCI